MNKHITITASSFIGFSLDRLAGLWNVQQSSENQIVYCSKISDVKIACQYSDVSGHSHVTPFGYDPATRSLSYDDTISFRPKIKADNSSPRVLYWLSGIVLEKPGIAVHV